MSIHRAKMHDGHSTCLLKVAEERDGACNSSRSLGVTELRLHSLQRKRPLNCITGRSQCTCSGTDFYWVSKRRARAMHEQRAYICIH